MLNDLLGFRLRGRLVGRLRVLDVWWKLHGLHVKWPWLLLLLLLLYLLLGKRLRLGMCHSLSVGWRLGLRVRYLGLAEDGLGQWLGQGRSLDR